MIHTVAALIEYLSSFMTLMPGDIILTGTPEGVVNVNPVTSSNARSTASAPC
jgi:5-oxopent-3-ene-1,2,5-tricarboxylate decarboxylase/2-hydroxyhepta-2,4-diene-1,7-dioate isomerase